LENIVSKEIREAGHVLRRPDTFLRWITSFAAATATTASYSEILDAATAGDNKKPSTITTSTYRDVLTNLWIIDEVAPWIPTLGEFSRLKQTPKHFLADPALSAALLQYDAAALRRGAEASAYDERYGTVTGRLFEALVCLSLQTYAQVNDAKLGYFRTARGEHEVDFVVDKERDIVAIEVKYSQTVRDRDVKHLVWLREKYGSRCKACVLVNAGPYAYRRQKDGVLVVPAALLTA
jgi:predicted AAA+ superfamily ATPase